MRDRSDESYRPPRPLPRDGPPRPEVPPRPITIRLVMEDLRAENEALRWWLKEVALAYHMLDHGRKRMFEVCREPTCYKVRILLSKEEEHA